MAERVTWLLAETEVAHAAVDLDEIRRSWPAPPHDPFNLDVELRNLAALAEIHASVGATHLVLAGVVESRRDRARYEDVVGGELTVYRLRAEPDDLRRRLHVRHADALSPTAAEAGDQAGAVSGARSVLVKNNRTNGLQLRIVSGRGLPIMRWSCRSSRRYGWPGGLEAGRAWAKIAAVRRWPHQ